MTPANVIFAGNFLYPVGMAGTKRVQHYVDAARSQPGWSVRVLLLRQNHPGRDDRRLCGVHGGVSYETVGADLQAGWRLPLAVLRYVAATVRFIVRHRRPGQQNVLVVYGEPNVENLPLILTAKLLGYQVIVDVVEDTYLTGANAPMLSRLKAWSGRRLTRHAGRLVDAVITLSSYLRDKFSALTGSRVPVYVVPVSVDLERFATRVPGQHAPRRIVYAGSFAEKDDVENLIEAFETVAGQQPAVELRLTGNGVASRMRSIYNRIQSSPRAAQIRQLGFLPDDEYFRELSEADVLCMVRAPTAFAERGFPFKLGEYLGTGRPVIATAVGDVPDYLEDRKSALLVPPGSVPALVEALEYVLSHPREATAIGEAGRRVAEECFDARVNGSRVVGIIADLANRAR